MSDWEHVLDDLVRVRGRALVRHAYLLTGDVAAAEDLVQDAIIATFARRSRVRSAVAVEGYVRRAILTTYSDGYRRQRRWHDVRHLLVRSDAAHGHESVVGDRADVVAALRTLAPRVRACVVLRFYEDLTVAEVADQLGLSEGAVKRYLSDGIRALEAVLGTVRDERETHTILERTTP
ncbi:sigma-70 family RNA polymerase sigma factor [Cellulomonas rhizosphaerae]|uniref:Sigma-70 family RNA polymerase sigma factor n=1 Tax=Cellulomonas rhizosphaerae TaxID=2293719 RepID=A0A413RPR2_9CELL|nr:sigma-70 family RNA polymerase sigma factor [Cellulomonas rhizosphaerae]RHA43933.1 sigma-70 family RNA polymerase sigma factor [Cellulomonas rhizosphaerae]